ncbi:tRNA A64-2'-O-ribosylphosphate transferase [Savitreella phatthalungensis]
MSEDSLDAEELPHVLSPKEAAEADALFSSLSIQARAPSAADPVSSRNCVLGASLTWASDLVQVRKDIRKSTRGLYDRLLSIREDSSFVSDAAAAWKLPAVANERAGVWYVPNPISTCYFKSTDGHYGKWAFSRRRLNLHVLCLAARHNGIVIVDSTRKGKSMPDALTKTIPIWCCVLNRAVSRIASHLKDPPSWLIDEDALALHVPRQAVSASEKASIESVIDGFVDDIVSGSFMNVACDVAPYLKDRPLRPLWVTPASTLTQAHPAELPFLPVVLVTASRAVSDGIERSRGRTYVQGAGDDEEFWSRGLTPSMLHSHPTDLLSFDNDPTDDTPREFLMERRIDELVARVRALAPSNLSDLETRESPNVLTIGEGTGIHLAAQMSPALCETYDLVIDLSLKHAVFQDSKSPPNYLHIPIDGSVTHARLITPILSAIAGAYAALHGSRKVVLTDDDLCKTKASTGAIMLAVLFSDAAEDGGEYMRADRRKRHEIDKPLVQRWTAQVTHLAAATQRPGGIVCQPARAWLKALNAYLMSPM